MPRASVALALLTLLSAAFGACAALYHRDVLGPSGVHAVAIGDAGSAYCSDDLGLVFPAVHCGTQGISAVIALDGSAGNGEADLNTVAPGSTFASGSCTVKQESALVRYTNGDFAFLCGVDRDDDGAVTNLDADLSADPDGFDDDFAAASVNGPFGSGTVGVCFRADGTNVAPVRWDFMHVFVEANVPSTSVGAGTFGVSASLTPSGSSCGTVSGHTHGAWYPASFDLGSWCGLPGVRVAGCLELLGRLQQ